MREMVLSPLRVFSAAMTSEKKKNGSELDHYFKNFLPQLILN